MGVPVTFLSPNTRSDTGANITGLNPTEHYLVIPWSEVAGAINSAGTPPNSLEDWFAAIDLTRVDKVTADTNSSGQKITPGRQFVSIDNGRATDEGQFETGTTMHVYSVLSAYYVPDSNASRPTASQL